MEKKNKILIRSIIIVSPFIIWFIIAFIVSVVALVSYVFTGETIWLFGIEEGRYSALLITGIFSIFPITYPFYKYSDLKEKRNCG